MWGESPALDTIKKLIRIREKLHEELGERRFIGEKEREREREDL